MGLNSNLNSVGSIHNSNLTAATQGGLPGSISLKIQTKETLKHILDHMDSLDLQPEDREKYLSAIRSMTIEYNTSTLYRELLEEENLKTLANKLFKIMQQTRQQDVVIFSECIWILCNLSCEPNVAPILIQDFGIFSVMETLLKSFCLSDQAGMAPFNRDLFEQIIWFLANLFGDSDHACHFALA